MPVVDRTAAPAWRNITIGGYGSRIAFAALTCPGRREGIAPHRRRTADRPVNGGLRFSLIRPTLPPCAPALIALAQEHVIRGIGDAAEGAGLLARALRRSAAGVEALDRRHVGEGAFALTFRHVELQPRDVVRRRASRADRNLA